MKIYSSQEDTIRLLKETIDPEKIHTGFNLGEPRIEGVNDDTLRLIIKNDYELSRQNRANLVICTTWDLILFINRTGRDERVFQEDIEEYMIVGDNPNTSGIFLRKKNIPYDTNYLRVYSPTVFGAREIDIGWIYTCDDETLLPDYKEDIIKRLKI